MSWRMNCDVCGNEDEVFSRQSLLCTGCLYTTGGAYWDALSYKARPLAVSRSGPKANHPS